MERAVTHRAVTHRAVRRILHSAGAAALLVGLAACAAVPSSPAPRFRAVALQPGDGLTIEDATDDVVFDITSKKGIGKIEFERLGAPPKTVTFHLHLKGLEEFRFTWANHRITGHVSSEDGTPREEASSADGQAAAIDPSSPYWMPVSIEAEDPTIPLTGGYFVVAAPPTFIQDQPTRFTLQWIDFYR
jgi:hypothetical protein